MTPAGSASDLAEVRSTSAPLWADVGRLAQELIRIDTSNPGGAERPAAELVADALSDLGAAVHWFEPSPGRASVVARIAGTERDLAPLLVHGHLDVVPANEREWSRDPFGGDLVDGYVWGRGAVDMKGSVASVLSSLWDMQRSGAAPRRDLVLAFFADEEAGGEVGAGHVTAERPELFVGAAAAIGEVGGFSYQLTADRRAYFVATGEKGVWWTRLTTHGQPGHGSMINPANPINTLADYIGRIATSFDVDRTSLTTTTTATFETLRELLGRPDAEVEELLAAVGPMQRMLRAGLCNTINPTQLEAGFKTNVVPGTAAVNLDGRFLPGAAEDFRNRLRSLLGTDATIDSLYFGDAVEADPGDSLLQVIGLALTAEDEAAVVVPYLSTAFTDAKWISKLDVPCYGFAPLLLPDDLDFTALFHGIDERVPIDALEFGVRVLHRLFTTY